MYPPSVIYPTHQDTKRPTTLEYGEKQSSLRGVDRIDSKELVDVELNSFLPS